jgi:16S rRNA (guanine(966)-N(2))-methyltransferase RsmD
MRGRRLQPPSNLPVRPTTDFAKESLFNILNNMIEFEELKVLDLFAGTGSITFEFISRGAISVCSVDINHRCIEFIKKTAENLAIENLSAVRGNVMHFLYHTAYMSNLVFADPPYDIPSLNKIPDLVLGSGILEPGGLLVLEHGAGHDFTSNASFLQHRHYGSVNFSFFRQSEVDVP